MMMDPALIDDLVWLDALEEEVENYTSGGAAEPMNVSHWDPSPRTRRMLQEYLAPATAPADGVAYRYSYVMDRQREVMERLGFEPRGKVCLYAPSGTAACLCATVLLAHQSPAAVGLLAPYYFVARQQLALAGLKVLEFPVVRREGRFALPADEALFGLSAIVLTSPVYSTGMYFGADDVGRLDRYLASGGIVLADESLAAPDRLISRILGHHAGFVGVYTPHKALCINGVKFACVVADRAHEDLLYRWGDIVYGSIAPSCLAAIRHYLSPAFAAADEWFLGEMAGRLGWLRRAAARLHGLELDAEPVGHFVTAYLKRPRPELGSDLRFMRRVMEQTGAVFLPGVRSRFDPAWGFSFRINLARADSPRFRGGLLRLFQFLLEERPGAPALFQHGEPDHVLRGVAAERGVL